VLDARRGGRPALGDVLDFDSAFPFDDRDA
jgi:hypothetical protein